MELRNPQVQFNNSARSSLSRMGGGGYSDNERQFLWTLTLCNINIHGKITSAFSTMFLIFFLFHSVIKCTFMCVFNFHIRFIVTITQLKLISLLTKNKHVRLGFKINLTFAYTYIALILLQNTQTQDIISCNSWYWLYYVFCCEIRSVNKDGMILFRCVSYSNKLKFVTYDKNIFRTSKRIESQFWTGKPNFYVLFRKFELNLSSFEAIKNWQFNIKLHIWIIRMCSKWIKVLKLWVFLWFYWIPVKSHSLQYVINIWRRICLLHGCVKDLFPLGKAF